MATSVLTLAEKALVNLDANALVSLYGHPFLFEDTSAAIRIDTKEELRAYFESLFQWPHVRFTNVSFFSIADRGAGQWTWLGRSRSSGTPFSVRGASLFKLAGQAIEEELIFYDPREAYA